MSPTFRGWSLAALMGLAGALGLAACSSSPSTSAGNTGAGHATGGSGASGGAGGSGATGGSGSSTTQTTHIGGGALVAVAPIPSQDRSPAGSAGTAPAVTVPSGSPPTQLESADLIKGTGKIAVDGATVTVEYVLATYSSGKVIQSSWIGQPYTFVLGKGQVIAGWDKGVVGMRVGGRRELIIPPSLGYHNESPGPGIAPNDTLVFVIDLVKAA